MVREEILKTACEIREQVSRAFSPETAYGRKVCAVPSGGHCAAVALIVRGLLGGDLLSVAYGDGSHWFNRVYAVEGPTDVDLTGDQFGLPAVRLGGQSELFSGARLRRLDEVREETILRALMLAERANLALATRALWSELERRRSLGPVDDATVAFRLANSLADRC